MHVILDKVAYSGRERGVKRGFDSRQGHTERRVNLVDYSRIQVEVPRQLLQVRFFSWRIDLDGQKRSCINLGRYLTIWYRAHNVRSP
jgi:hypothetical protein